MFIDKNGKVVSNKATPTIIFENSEAYNTWKANLPDGLTEDDFNIVFNYLIEPGSYCEVNILDELNALPTEMKAEGVLYGAREDRKLYFYDAINGVFTSYLGG